MLDLLKNQGLQVLNNAVCEEESTIVVVGVPRSGTTMIALTLAELGIFMGDEIDTTTWEDRRVARAIEDNPADLLSVVADYNGRHKVWGFKRPAAYRQASNFIGDLRNPRFIIPFRDPLAIAKREEISMMFDFRKHLVEAARWTLDLAEFALRQTAPILLISYEKAIASPPAMIDAVAMFTGVDLSKPELNRIAGSVQNGPSDYLIGSQVRYAR